MLEVTGLNTFYGGAHILTDVSLGVGGNEVVALLGRNGAGKSTTMKSIMGARFARARAASSCLRRAPRSPARSPSAPDHRQGLGYVPEERRVFAGLTVEENLEVGRRAPRQGAPLFRRGTAVRALSQPCRAEAPPAGPAGCRAASSRC
ncbi:MAG: hypothetical protein AcusKO_49480 [Acuticoccus sp.]